MLYINHIEKETKVLGPGKRYVIWVQGCKKHCPGCINPAGRSINTNGTYVDVSEIFTDIQEVAGLTGVTISGGEPFLQAEELVELVKLLRKETTLDIMMYSGYTIDELLSWNNLHVKYLLENIDILIDGEYIEGLNNNKMYRGSDNQRIIFLSPKYARFRTLMETTKSRPVEFVVRDKEVFIVGIPEKGFNEKLWFGLKAYLEEKDKR